MKLNLLWRYVFPEILTWNATYYVHFLADCFAQFILYILFDPCCTLKLVWLEPGAIL